MAEVVGPDPTPTRRTPGTGLATRGGDHRYAPRRLPAAAEPRLRAALAREHGRAPFGPRDVRDAARRVAAVAIGCGFRSEIARGGLDVGGAELDHLWALVDGVVVDVTLPLWSDRFTATLRAYIAGDVSDEALDRGVHGYPLRWRVVGEFPGGVRYVGSPVWSGRPGVA